MDWYPCHSILSTVGLNLQNLLRERVRMRPHAAQEAAFRCEFHGKATGSGATSRGPELVRRPREREHFPVNTTTTFEERRRKNSEPTLRQGDEEIDSVLR